MGRFSPLSALSDLRETRLEKAAALAALGQGPYALRFEPSHRTAALQQDHAGLANGEERQLEVAVAGRVMTRRVMGKLAFFTLADETGPIQLFIEKATLEASMPEDPEAFAHLTSLVDAGDLIGVQGSLRRTDRGELSVKVKGWTMLCKSLQPLPDKWHGLADVEKWEIETIHKAFANVGVPWGGTISEARPAAPATTGGGVPTSAVAPAPTKPVTKKTTAVPPAPKAQEKAATPKPAPQAETTDGIPGLAPENGGPASIPAQSGTEPSDPDLEKVVGTNEEQVNAYLVSQKRIQAGQTFRSVAPDYRNRILKNPGGFFSVVANWRGNAA